MSEFRKLLVQVVVEVYIKKQGGAYDACSKSPTNGPLWLYRGGANMRFAL